MAPFLLFTFVTLLVSFLVSPTGAVRAHDRRSDLKGIPPVSELGWTVPLAGGNSCVPNIGCYSTLSRPAENKTLQALAIGHGIFNYSCEGLAPANAPAFIAQYTELYDAAALAANLPNEQLFHDLIPKLYDFDLRELDNSSLTCMGSVGTLDSSAVITLYNIDTFRATLFETVESPVNASFNGLWSHSASPDHAWDVYRVEMAGGAVPETCADQPSDINIDYVAEYWFYH